MTVMVEMMMDKKKWLGPLLQTTGASNSKTIRIRKKWPGRHKTARLPAGKSDKAVTRGARAHSSKGMTSLVPYRMTRTMMARMILVGCLGSIREVDRLPCVHQRYRSSQTGVLTTCLQPARQA